MKTLPRADSSLLQRRVRLQAVGGQQRLRTGWKTAVISQSGGI